MFAAVSLAAAMLGYRAWSRRSGAAEPQQVGYPLLDTVKHIADDLWIADSTIAASGLALPIRMTIVKLSGGGLLLHSPTRFTAELADEIEALGPVEHLIAPTFAHWMHLADWKRAFPNAKTWGVPGLRDRAQVRNAGTPIDLDLEDEAPSEWQEDLEQLLVRGGGGFVEAVFLHRASRTLLLADLIENLEAAKLPPVTRLLAQVFLGTRATTALHVRAAVMLGGDVAKAAVRSLISWEPERVILAHGESFDSDAAQRLRKASAWLV